MAAPKKTESKTDPKASVFFERELTADDFLAASGADLAPVRVEIPSMQGHVYMRCMTGEEGVAFQEIIADAEKRKRGRQYLIAACTCTKDGKRMFSMSQVEALGARSINALNELQDHAQRVNRLGKYALKDSDQEAPKNASSEGQRDDSPIASPAS